MGIATKPGVEGYWLATAKGNVFNLGLPWYGSMAGKALPAPVVGVAGA